MKELGRLINDSIRYAQFAQEMEIVASTCVDASLALYTCKDKNGALYRRVKGAPGFTGRAIVGFVANDRQRPEIVAPGSNRSTAQSSFVMP